MLREFMGGGFPCSNSNRIAQCSSSIYNLLPRTPADANPSMNRLGSKQKTDD